MLGYFTVVLPSKEKGGWPLRKQVSGKTNNRQNWEGRLYWSRYLKGTGGRVFYD